MRSPTARDAAEGLAEIEAEIVRIMRDELDWPEEKDPDDATGDVLRRIAKRLAALRSAGTEGGETQEAEISRPKPPRGGPIETRPRGGAKILAGLKDVLAFTEGDTDRAELRTFAVRDGAVVAVEPGSAGGKPIADVFRGALAGAKDALVEAKTREAAEAMCEAAKTACLDLADVYREAGEDHIRNGAAVKARQALDWADGAMMCAHAVAKLSARTTDGGEA